MTLTQDYRASKRYYETGHACQGDTCRVWFLSDFDTWHACPCNCSKQIPEPETCELWTYAVTISLEGGERWAVSSHYRLDQAREAAASLQERRGKGDVKLSRHFDDDVARIELQIGHYEEWLTDRGD